MSCYRILLMAWCSVLMSWTPCAFAGVSYDELLAEVDILVIMEDVDGLAALIGKLAVHKDRDERLLETIVKGLRVDGVASRMSVTSGGRDKEAHDQGAAKRGDGTPVDIYVVAGETASLNSLPLVVETIGDAEHPAGPDFVRTLDTILKKNKEKKIPDAATLTKTLIGCYFSKGGMRPGLPGLRRALISPIVSIADPSAVPFLGGLLQDADPEIVKLAASGLQQIASPEAIGILEKTFFADQRNRSRRDIVLAALIAYYRSSGRPNAQVLNDGFHGDNGPGMRLEAIKYLLETGLLEPEHVPGFHLWLPEHQNVLRNSAEMMAQKLHLPPKGEQPPVVLRTLSLRVADGDANDDREFFQIALRAPSDVAPFAFATTELNPVDGGAPRVRPTADICVADEGNWRDLWFEGLSPLPDEYKIIQKLAADITTCFWVNISIPAGVPPGIYRGHVNFSGKGMDKREVPIEVEVRAQREPEGWTTVAEDRFDREEITTLWRDEGQSYYARPGDRFSIKDGQLYLEGYTGMLLQRDFPGDVRIEWDMRPLPDEIPDGQQRYGAFAYGNDKAICYSKHLYINRNRSEKDFDLGFYLTAGSVHRAQGSRRIEMKMHKMHRLILEITGKEGIYYSKSVRFWVDGEILMDAEGDSPLQGIPPQQKTGVYVHAARALFDNFRVMVPTEKAERDAQVQKVPKAEWSANPDCKPFDEPRMPYLRDELLATGYRLVVAMSKRKGLGYEHHPRDLYLMNADGSGAVNISNTPDLDEFEPRVSPDGRYMVYNHGAFLMDLSTMKSRKYDGGTAWTPDGKETIAVRDGRIVHIGLAGEIGKTVDLGMEARVLDLSPDGRHYLLATLNDHGEQTGVLRLATAGGHAVKLTGVRNELYHPDRPAQTTTHAALSPDGRWLCWDDSGVWMYPGGKGNLKIAEFDPSSEKGFRGEPVEFNNWLVGEQPSGRWSRCGRYLALMCMQRGVSSREFNHIVVFRIADSQNITLTPPGWVGRHWDYDWLPSKTL